MGPQAAHDGHRVRLALHQPAARQGNGRARHQQGDQGRQMKEAGGALHRRREFRPGLTGVDQTDVGGRGGLDTALEVPHRLRLAGRQEAVAHSAGRGDQAGGRYVRQIHHHPRRELKQVGPSVRLVGDDAADAEAGLSKRDFVAGPRVEQVQQPGLNPKLPGRGTPGHGLFDGLESLPNAQLSPQGIVGGDCLDLDELWTRVTEHDAWKLQGLCRFQTQRACVFLVAVRDRRGAVEHQVGTDQLTSLALHGLFDAVGEEPDRGDGRHRYHQRCNEQVQLAASPVLTQQA